MKKKIEHTPTPWRRGRGAGYLTVGPLIVANDNQEANAAFVERAVNAHDDLVAAAQNARNVLAALVAGDLKEIKADSPALAMLRAALAKAEGK